MLREIQNLSDLTQEERRLVIMAFCSPYIISMIYFVLYPFIN